MTHSGHRRGNFAVTHNAALFGKLCPGATSSHSWAARPIRARMTTKGDTMKMEAQRAVDPRVVDLVRAGQVRVGLFASFLYAKDRTTGELRGVGIEIARALAARLGVEVLIVERSDPAEIVECLKAGACDVALLGITAGRAAELDFSPPYLQADLTYLVPAGSSVRRAADADQHGVRIAVVRNHAMDFALRGKLKQAEPMYAETPDAAFDLIGTGQVTVPEGERQESCTS